MTDINHEIKIQRSINEVYHAVTSLNDLKSWYCANMDGDAHLNGILIIQPEDKPAFRWKIIIAEPDQRLVWECIDGPGDSIGTKAIFTFSKVDDKQTLVEFTHDNWPGQHGNYRKCNTLWAILLHHLKNYLETGKVDPAFS